VSSSSAPCATARPYASSTSVTAYRSLVGSTPSTGAYSSATNEIALRPRIAPEGATRNTSSPAPRPVISPTAPVSQNSMPRRADASAAGSEIVLP
jgi:hypothetical protein